MPEMMPSQGAPGQGSPGQAPGQAAQPPFGAGQAMGPTANRGHEQLGLQKLGAIVQQLSEILPLVGPTSELGQAVVKSMQSLAKLVPPGTSSPASTASHLQGAQVKNLQNAQMMQQIMQRGQGGGGGGGQPQAPPQGMGAG